MFSCNLDLISWHFEYCQRVFFFFLNSGVDWLFQQQILENICRIKPTNKNIYVTVFSYDIRGHSISHALHLFQELWLQGWAFLIIVLSFLPLLFPTYKVLRMGNLIVWWDIVLYLDISLSVGKNEKQGWQPHWKSL
jgi:hypothetical protein